MNLIAKMFKKTILQEAKQLSRVDMLERIQQAESERSSKHIDCRMVTIDCTEGNTVAEALGISDEKQKKLAKMMDKIVAGNKKSISQIMIEASANCIHPNELGYVNYLLGLYAAKQGGSGSGGMDPAMLAMLMALMGKGRPGGGNPFGNSNQEGEDDE